MGLLEWLNAIDPRSAR